MARGHLVVRRLSNKVTRGALVLGGLRFACALGRSGCGARKSEGDGATPTGTFRLVDVLYRADRRRRPRTGLPVRPIRRDDGWCDDKRDRNYNRAVQLPYPASTESLWRDDGVYDIVVVLDHNQRPRIRGEGSAIFIHVARPGYPPTEGCVALAARDLEVLLGRLGQGSTVVVR
jgi:L,D-peptidoglycan transpeptidase YkuD (ErfK/YbiS/YcfS/YnhG family)